MTHHVLRATAIASVPLGMSFLLFGLFFKNWGLAAVVVTVELLSILVAVAVVRKGS
jgi:hypothetical protein